MKFLNWNILSGGSARKEKIIDTIANYELDVVALTEFRHGKAGEYLASQLHQLGFIHQVSTVKRSNAHNGVLLVSRIEVGDAAGPAIPIELHHNVLRCRIAGFDIIAAFCNAQPTFVALSNYLVNCQHDQTLVVGDLLHGDRKSDAKHYDRSLKRLLDSGWVDCWRRDNPDAVLFCHTNKGNGGQSRPDHVFAKSQSAGSVVNCNYDMLPLEAGLSDHAPMSFAVENFGVMAVTLPALIASGVGDQRVSLAMHQLMMACRHAARVRQLEREFAGQECGEWFEEVFQNCLGVAMQTAACLESTAIELVIDTKHLPKVGNYKKDPTRFEVSLLAKFDKLLVSRQRKRVAVDDPLTKKISALIELRNALTHFRPEWGLEESSHAELSKTLKSMFEPSTFVEANRVFPLAWASLGFADWALDSTIAFLRMMYAELDIPCPVEMVQDKLISLRA